ncbi:MAG TPA: ABC transporter substrate-binding protein [Rhizobiaceae bacterium]|nr:ABC transporter substrate-binding protein [Rhizobiaceae bacterium]
MKRNKSERQRRLGAVAASLFLALASGTAVHAADLTTIRIGAASNVLFGPVFVLADPSNGIAAKHGLKVDSRIFASGIATMEAALAGDIDVAFPNTRVLLPMLLSGKACFKGGITFVDVNTVDLATTSDINSPEQLVGKKIGTQKGGIGEVALQMWLKSKNIDPKKVEMVNVSPEDMPIAFAQGTVDGIIWPEPTPSLALQMMGKKAHLFGDISSAFRDVSPVNVTCAWVKKNGDKGMENLVAAWIDAVKFIKENPEKGIAITASSLQLSPDDVKKFWKMGGWPGGWPADLKDSELEMYDRYGDYLKSIGELKQMPDLSKWIDSKWLKKVAPDRVKLDKYHL